MQYTFHITVHFYAEDELCDLYLKPYCRYYGIFDRNIVSPLRRINGKTLSLDIDSDVTSMGELWLGIGIEIYGSETKYREYGESSGLEFYLVKNQLRFSLENEKLHLSYYLDRLGVGVEKPIEIQLLLCMDAGEVFRDDGIRYYMHSKEYCSHNEPHVHVDIRHEKEGSFSILSGIQLAGDKIKTRDIRRIERMIRDRKEELIEYWNLNTDGIKVDLNQALGKIRY